GPLLLPLRRRLQYLCAIAGGGRTGNGVAGTVSGREASAPRQPGKECRRARRGTQVSRPQDPLERQAGDRPQKLGTRPRAHSGDHSTKPWSKLCAGDPRDLHLPQRLVALLPRRDVPGRPDPDGRMAPEKAALLTTSAMQAGTRGGALVASSRRFPLAGGSPGL